MWDNTIGKQISRTNRSLLLLNLFGLAVVVFATAISARAMVNLIFGPFDLTGAELAKIEDPTKRWQYNVRIKGTALSAPIYQKFTLYKDKKTGQSSSKYIDAVYHLLGVDDTHFILVDGGSAGAGGTELRGALVRIPEALKTGAIGQLPPGLRSHILPLMLDTTKFRSFDFFTPVLMLSVFALVVWNLKKLRQRKGDLRFHPMHRILSRHGSPEEVAREFENEVKVAGKPAFPHLIVTKNWLYCPTMFSANLQKFDDVVWAYLQQTNHSVNFIPTGQTFRCMIYFNDGKAMEMSASKAVVEELLMVVATRVPWAYLGYSSDLSKHWSKDKKGMIDAVAKAKVDFESHQKQQDSPDV